MQTMKERSEMYEKRLDKAFFYGAWAFIIMMGVLIVGVYVL